MRDVRLVELRARDADPIRRFAAMRGRICDEDGGLSAQPAQGSGHAPECNPAEVCNSGFPANNGFSFAVSEPASHRETDDHALLRQTVRQFAQTRVEPQAMAHDESGEFNAPLLRALGELGLIGITIPEADGGAGLDAVASCIVHDELAYCDPGFTLGYLAHALLFVNNFYWAGSAAQRAKYLPGVLSGATIGAMGMTEPSVGTDVLGLHTTARKVGATYVLDGHKTFITNGLEANVFLIYAKLDSRITTFVVERGYPGFTTSAKIAKMGMRASSMCELSFEGAVVPVENLLGHEGGGITNMMRNLEIERLGLAAMSLGHGAALPRRDDAVRAPNAIRSASRSRSTGRSSATSASRTRRSKRCAR